MRNLAMKPAEFDSLDGVEVLALDVIDAASIAEAVTQAEAKNGSVDALLNVAGYIVQGAVEEVPLAEWRSQFAVEGLTESLSREVKHLGIRVTMVEPGVFETELGSSASQTENPSDAYDAAAEQMPDLYDWTPGDLDASARAIVTISEETMRRCASTWSTASIRCAATTTSASRSGRATKTSRTRRRRRADDD